MDEEEALKHLHAITDGIDRDETKDDGGWWETSAGAIFGAEKLSELEDLVKCLTRR